MRFEIRATAEHIIRSLSNSKAAIGGYIDGIVEARRRRAEQETEFYLRLRAHCDANGVSPVCADDWKTYSYYQKGTASLVEPLNALKGVPHGQW